MRAGLLLLTLSVVLAGCSGWGGEGTTETVSPAPVPEATAEATEVPPGISGRTVTNSDTLMLAHAAITGTRSHRLRSVWTARYMNGSLYASVHQRVRVSADRKRFFATFDTEGPHASVLGFRNARFALYSDGEHLYQAVTKAGTTEYSVGSLHLGESFHVSVSRANPRWRLAVLIGALNPRLAEPPSEGTNGSFRLVSSERAPPWEFALEVAGKTPRNVSFEMLVTEDGLVTSYRLAYSAFVEGGRIRVVRTVEYTDIGQTSVSRPSWITRLDESTEDTAKG
jgi:hypothetical protein